MSKKNRINRQIEYAKKQGKFVPSQTERVSDKEAVKENNKRRVFGKDAILDIQFGTVGLYAVYDRDTGKYGHVLTSPNHVSIVRFLSQSLKNGQVMNPDWLVEKENYDLYLVGYFSEDGSIKTILHPVRIINFSEI